MMISPRDRKRIVMSQEGQILSAVGEHDADMAAEIARLRVDGIMNALIRIEGPEAASRYAFAVSDRVAAGGLRAPTDFVLPAPVTIEASAPPPHKPKRQWSASYGWGLFHGAIFAAWALYMLRAR